MKLSSRMNYHQNRGNVKRVTIGWTDFVWAAKKDQNHPKHNLELLKTIIQAGRKHGPPKQENF